MKHKLLLIITTIGIFTLNIHSQSILTGEALDLGDDTYSLNLAASGGEIDIFSSVGLFPRLTPAQIQSFSIESDTTGAGWYVLHEFLNVAGGAIILAPQHPPLPVTWVDGGELKVIFNVVPGTGEYHTIEVDPQDLRSNGIQISNFNVPVTPVPEPGHYLAITAIWLILFAAKYRQRTHVRARGGS